MIMYNDWIVFMLLVASLGCYKCSSVNGSNPDCDDEFVAKDAFYSPNCMAARKSYSKDNGKMLSGVRTGLYPATWCIKFKAIDSKFTKKKVKITLITNICKYTLNILPLCNDLT